jgi:S1-C subfamily serine protease
MANKSPINGLLVVLGLAAVSLAAGAAMASLVADSAIGSLIVATTVSSSAVRPSQSVNVTRVSESSRAVVTIYKKRAGVSLLDKVLLPSDRVGAGIVLTSDGWMALPTSLLNSGPLIAVFSDVPSLDIDSAKAVRDEATGIAFMKLDAQRLAVAPFGDDYALHAADPVFLADSSSIAASSVLTPRLLPASVRSDYLESSERLSRRIVIDLDGLPGAAVVNADGATVGLCLGGGTVLPISFIEEVMRGVFRDREVIRPKLGIRFVSLDTLPDAKTISPDVSGAQLVSLGSIRAVAKGSSAEEAGLKEGDVITAVEHDRINGEATLSERLQDYAPGAEVELTVLRDGKTVKLKATLR